jgi:hypothetical protein
MTLRLSRRILLFPLVLACFIPILISLMSFGTALPNLSLVQLQFVPPPQDGVAGVPYVVSNGFTNVDSVFVRPVSLSLSLFFLADGVVKFSLWYVSAKTVLSLGW